jgi:ribosomal protein L22
VTETPENPEEREEEPTGTAAAAPEDVAPEAEEPAAEETRRRRLSRARRSRAPGSVAETPTVVVPEPVPTPAPAARRQPGTRVVVRAQAKYVRSSARKARLVCDLIRGQDVEHARAVLAHSTRDVARAWTKVLESAVANAENNHDLDSDELKIHAVHADEGPTLKRFRPRAMGRATPIRKRTAHLTVLLTPKE